MSAKNASLGLLLLATALTKLCGVSAKCSASVLYTPLPSGMATSGLPRG